MTRQVELPRIQLEKNIEMGTVPSFQHVFFFYNVKVNFRFRIKSIPITEKKFRKKIGISHQTGLKSKVTDFFYKNVVDVCSTCPFIVIVCTISSGWVNFI